MMLTLFVAKVLKSRPRHGAPHNIDLLPNSFIHNQSQLLQVPLLHLKRKVGVTNCEYSANLTGVYLDILYEIVTSGLLQG
jgi:hypothetical protein